LGFGVWSSAGLGAWGVNLELGVLQIVQTAATATATVQAARPAAVGTTEVASRFSSTWRLPSGATRTSPLAAAVSCGASTSHFADDPVPSPSPRLSAHRTRHIKPDAAGAKAASFPSKQARAKAQAQNQKKHGWCVLAVGGGRGGLLGWPRGISCRGGRRTVSRALSFPGSWRCRGLWPCIPSRRWSCAIRSSWCDLLAMEVESCCV
jgi:hypothetical protein